MPFSGLTFTKLYNWLTDAPNNKKIFNSRLEDEFSGIATGLTEVASGGGGTVPTTRLITSGAGLTGGGDLSADRTLDVGAGTGITVNANDVALTVPVSVANGGTGSTVEKYVELAGDTMSGTLAVSNSVGTIAAPTNYGLIVASSGSGNAAMVPFHIPSITIQYFGIDSDGDWKIGGGTLGAVAHKIWHAGNVVPVANGGTGSSAEKYVELAGDTMTGDLTINPTTGHAHLSINTTEAAKQASILLYQTSVEKWNIGKQTDNTFYVYDSAAAGYALQIPSGGTTITLSKSVTTTSPLTIEYSSSNSVFVTLNNTFAGAHSWAIASSGGGPAANGSLVFFDNTAGGALVTIAGTTGNMVLAGTLTLPGDPTSALHAATKDYVDSLVITSALPNTLIAFGADNTGAADVSTELTAALAAFDEVILTAGTYRLDDNYTVAADKTLRFEGAQFTVDSGKTLTIYGAVLASPNSQIFTGAGDVVGIRDVYAAWWGVVADFNDSTGDGTDNSAAFQAAFDCVAASYDGRGGPQRVRLPPGKYGILSTIQFTPSNTFLPIIEGAGSQTGGTEIWLDKDSADTRAIKVGADGSSDNGVWYCLKDFRIMSRAADGAGISGLLLGTSGFNINATNHCPIENIDIRGFQYGIYQHGVRCVMFDNVHVDVSGVSNGIGLYMNPSSSGVSGDTEIRKLEVEGSSSSVGVQIEANVAAGSCTGIRLHGGCVFYACGTGVKAIVSVSGTASAFASRSGISDLWIMPGCQFECTTAVHAEIASTIDNAYIINVNVNGTYIQNSGGTTKGVYIADNGDADADVRTVKVVNNFINGITSNNVEFYQVNNFTVSHNSCSDGAGTSGQAILLHTCISGTVMGNTGYSSSGSTTTTDFIEVDGGSTARLTLIGNRATGLFSGSCVNNVSGVGSPSIKSTDND